MDIRTVRKYAFINARVRAMMSKLLTKEVIDSLIDAKDFRTVVGLLEQSSYGSRLETLQFEEINSENLDRIFSEDFINTFNTVFNISPHTVKECLNKIRMKFEARTLKTILRAKAANLILEEAMRYLIPVGSFSREFCEELLKEKKSLREIVESIPIQVFRDTLEENWKIYEETQSILPLEIAVDKAAFKEIWKYIEDEMSGLDKQIVEHVIGTEIDTINIKIILRGKILKLEYDFIQNLLLEANYKLEEEIIRQSLQANSIGEVIKIVAVPPYQAILNKALKEYKKERSLAIFEMELDKLIYEVSREAGFGSPFRYGYPFQIGTILCYLNLKWFEIRNLKTIIVGKEERASPTQIRKYLI